MTTSPDFADHRIHQTAWRTATLDGKVYGIPINMFYVEFLANKAVFDRAGVAIPTDWPSLLDAVKALKAKGELPWAISIGPIDSRSSNAARSAGDPFVWPFFLTGFPSLCRHRQSAPYTNRRSSVRRPS